MGTSNNFANSRATSVLPVPVGPKMRMLLFSSTHCGLAPSCSRCLCPDPAPSSDPSSVSVESTSRRNRVPSTDSRSGGGGGRGSCDGGGTPRSPPRSLPRSPPRSWSPRVPAALPNPPSLVLAMRRRVPRPPTLTVSSTLPPPSTAPTFDATLATPRASNTGGAATMSPSRSTSDAPDPNAARTLGDHASAVAPRAHRSPLQRAA
mmetsp:Transcript_1929/g.5788  ORF Transcript_1929/g.5788 Transcript_1929/m.5788 type:complete len:205 (-) Transcript_1929:230-844(-)